MSQHTRLHSRRNELQERWQRLSQLFQAVQQQRDLETRVEECLRLDAVLAQREAERQQVEAQLQAIEHELTTRHNAGDQPVAPTGQRTDTGIERPHGTSRAAFHATPGLATPPPPASGTRLVTLFYSYAHSDEALRDQLAKHLTLLQRQGVISAWHDREIPPGGVWEEEILGHLEQADMILLLVSADFLASEYCWHKEVARAMARQQAGTARVIPILLRPVDWSLAPFSQLQVLPKDARPVTSWPNQEEAFVDIARGIRQVALALQKPSRASA